MIGLRHRGGTLVARDKNGDINLLNLLVLSELGIDLESVDEADVPDDRPTDTFSPIWNVGDFVVKAYEIIWVDEYGTLDLSASLFVESFELKNLGSDLSQQTEVIASYLIAGEGRAGVNGTVSLDGNHADIYLDVEAIPMPIGADYVKLYTGVDLLSGIYSLTGRVTRNSDGNNAFQGRTAVSDLRVGYASAPLANLGWDLFEWQGRIDVFADLKVKVAGQTQLNGLSGSLLEEDAVQFGWDAYLWDGEIVLTPELTLSLIGETSLTGLRAAARIGHEADFSLDALQVEGIQFTYPEAYEIESIRVDKPRGALVLMPQPEVNTADDEGTVEAAAEPTELPELPPVRIGSVKVADGHFVASDRVIEPNFTMEIEALNLRIKDLSSDPANVSTLKMTAEANHAPLTVDGTLTPLDPIEKTELRVTMQSLALPPMTPYSGKAIGRSIENGQFNMTGDWKVIDGQLKAKNSILIDDFNLGGNVPSETALKLPYDLAIALLKRGDGSIKMSLPVSGDLTDPKVGIGQLVVSAFVGVVTKAATSPFSLLAGAVGSEKDLSRVGFEPARRSLTTDTIETLNLLSDALNDRPAVKLKLVPSISEADVEAMQLAALKARIQSEVGEEDEEAYNARVLQEYRVAFEGATSQSMTTREAALRSSTRTRGGNSSKPDETGVQPATAEDYAKLESQLATREEVPVERIQQLNTKRSNAILRHLTEVRQVDAERVVVDEAALGATAVGESDAQMAFNLF